MYSQFATSKDRVFWVVSSFLIAQGTGTKGQANICSSFKMSAWMLQTSHLLIFHWLKQNDCAKAMTEVNGGWRVLSVNKEIRVNN